MDNTIATNKKAFRDYSIIERYESGIVLKGSEVKSLREKRASINDSFARVENDGIMLYNCHISSYEKRDGFDKLEPTRPRKLLLHKKEIERLAQKVAERGLSLVPLALYFNKRGLAKIELALVKGKKIFDKRKQVKERELQRGLRRLEQHKR